MKHFKHTKKVKKMKHTSLSPFPPHTLSLTDGNILPHLFYVSVVRKQCTDTGKPPPSKPAPCSLFRGGCFPEVVLWLSSYLFGCAGCLLAMHTLSLVVQSGGDSLVVLCGLYIAVASLAVEQGSWVCRLQQLRHGGSVVVACWALEYSGFSRYNRWAW